MIIIYLNIKIRTRPRKANYCVQKQVRSGNNSISPDNVPRTRVRLSHHPFVNFLLSLMVGCAAGAIAGMSVLLSVSFFLSAFVFIVVFLYF